MLNLAPKIVSPFSTYGLGVRYICSLAPVGASGLSLWEGPTDVRTWAVADLEGGWVAPPPPPVGILFFYSTSTQPSKCPSRRSATLKHLFCILWSFASSVSVQAFSTMFSYSINGSILHLYIHTAHFVVIELRISESIWSFSPTFLLTFDIWLLISQILR